MIKRENGADRPDPSAGGKADKDRRREKRLEKIQQLEDYEQLCREFRKRAAEKGYTFPDRCWLLHEKTGRIFKHG